MLFRSTSQIVKDGGGSKIEVTFKLSPETAKEIDIDKVVEDLSDKTKAVSIQVFNHH